MRAALPLPAARVVLVIGAAGLLAAHCGDRHAPTAPGPFAASNGAPIIRTITLDRQNVTAGQDVSASAQIDDPSSGGLRYQWSVAPSSGTVDDNGATGLWHSPANDPVPRTYTLTLTIVKPYIGVDSAGNPANLEYRVTASSAPITVNDAERELKAAGEAFLADFMNANVTPDMCVRNFADSCSGKQKAMQDIVAARAGYSTATVTYHFHLFQLGNDAAGCTALNGSTTCAVALYDVEWIRTRVSDGTQDRVTGTESFTGTYDRNHWALCTSGFSPQ